MATKTDWEQRLRHDFGSEFAALMLRILREFAEEAAKLAESAFGAGAHMQHNRVIAAAIRSLLPPKKED